MPDNERSLISRRRFSNEISAAEAIRITEKIRTAERKRKLEYQAELYIPDAFDKIVEAAQRGKGEVHRLLPGDCPMTVQLVVMDYLRACGYAIHPDPSGGVVRWCSDEEVEE